MILAPLQKLPKNVRDLGKLIDAKGFKSRPKCKKSPTLVTLADSQMKHFQLNYLVPIIKNDTFLAVLCYKNLNAI